MKKFIAIALVLALASSFAACKKLETTDTSTITKRPYYVDEEGNTIYAQAQTNEDGDVEFFVTNANGETSKLDKDNLVVEEITNADQYLEILDIIENNPEQMVDTDIPESNLEIADGVIPEDTFTEIEVELDENGNPKHENSNLSYKEIVESDTYTIDTTMQLTSNGEQITFPATIMKSGDNLYLDVAIPYEGTNGSLKVGVLANSEKTYFIVPSLKTYIVADETTINDIFPLDDIKQEISESKSESYSHSGTVEINGKTYTCDVYESEGTTTKYYFDEKGNNVRIENTNGSDSSIIEIKSMTNEVDSSKFKIPSNYVDLSVIVNENIDISSLIS